MTIGAIISPKISPNLTQVLLRGSKIFDFNRPKTKKVIATIIDHILRLSSLSIGQMAIKKNTRKNKMPKLLFELLFDFIFSNIFTLILFVVSCQFF